VAKNSYKAAAVQRAFLDADERFKNVVTRYSGRVGSALAYSSRSSGGSVLKEVLVSDDLSLLLCLSLTLSSSQMFGLCIESPPRKLSQDSEGPGFEGTNERHWSVESDERGPHPLHLSLTHSPTPDRPPVLPIW
jgi:hypothetical protein